MESIARLVALIAGIAIVVLTLWSVFTSLVLPRATSSHTMRGLARFLSGSARRLAPRLPNYEVRDRVLSFVGPGAVVALFGVWICLILFGFSLLIWWDLGVNFLEAVGIAGSSVTTLGIAASSGAGADPGDPGRRQRPRRRRPRDRLPPGALQRVRHPGD